jgi:hypothetical protein
MCTEAIKEMRTGFLKRIRVLETKSRRPRWLVCLRDVENDLFIGACGDKISHSQFLEWVQQQDNDTGIILLEVQNENDNLKITVDNYLQYNQVALS